MSISKMQVSATTKDNRRVAFHSACQKGDWALVESLLYDGWETDTDVDGKIAIHYACMSGSTMLVKKLLRSKACFLSKTDFDGNTPMHIACKYGYGKIVQLFIPLYNEKIIHTKNVFGRTPLHEACASGDISTVQILLQKNKSVMQVLTYSENLQILSCENKLAMQIADQDGKFPIHHACQSGNYDVVKYLLSYYRKGKFQLRDEYQKYPIHYACEKGGKDLIQFLWEQYPDAFSTMDAMGQTPLNVAINSRNYRIISLLREKRLEADIQLLLNDMQSSSINDEKAKSINLISPHLDKGNNTIPSLSLDDDSLINKTEKGLLHNKQRVRSKSWRTIFQYIQGRIHCMIRRALSFPNYHYYYLHNNDQHYCDNNSVDETFISVYE